ncbi:DeoR family transcriptional regulator (plasmid) [Sinorhizobium meliloti]|nr:DeoR family transcriptional regulator [Sinorhizobium meliloti]
MSKLPNTRALAPRRHEEILRRVASEGSVSIAELAAYFDVSRETIRRDMKLLADRGQLDVVHGGATLFEATEPALVLRSGGKRRCKGSDRPQGGRTGEGRHGGLPRFRHDDAGRLACIERSA